MLLSGDISCVTRDSNCCWSFAITATILPNLWFERMRVIFPEWNILAAKELFKFWRDHLQHCQNLIVYHELRRFCVEFLVEYRGPGPLPDLDITTPTTTTDVWRSNQKLEKNMQGFYVNATCFLADFFFFLIARWTLSKRVPTLSSLLPANKRSLTLNGHLMSLSTNK